MSLHRYIGCMRAGLSIRNAGVAIRCRWQSSGSSSRGSRRTLWKILGATGLIAGATGGVLVYANYNPVFKYRVDDMVPGFSAMADGAADLYVGMLDYFHSKLGIPVKYSKEGKAYLEEILKGESAESSFPQNKKTPMNDAGSKKESDEDTGIVEKSGDGKTSIGKLEADEGMDEGDDQRINVVTKATKEDQVAVFNSGGSSSQPFPAVSGTEVAAGTSPAPVVEGTPQSPKKDMSASLPVATPSGSDNVGGASRSETEDVAGPVLDVTTEESYTTTQDPPSRDLRLTDPTKIGDVLEEAYKKFLVDSQTVKEAQQGLMRAWEDLYMRSTAPATEVEGVDQQITDAKSAALVANNQLKTATAEYDASCKNLEELAQYAPNEGFVTRASTITSEMKLKAAEVNLGLVLVKEAIANAEVVEAYQSAVQESRNQLQKELEAAASMIDPKEKDSLIMSLSKKFEILQCKLKKSEIEHARRLAVALEVQRRSMEQFGEEKLKHHLKESEAKYLKQVTEEVNKASTEHHNMLREQLRLEHESHLQEMEESLRQQTAQLSALCKMEIEYRLARQESYYQLELARAQARLTGVESMVDTVASTGEKTIQLQTLHNSSDALVRALQKLNSDQDKKCRFILGVDLESIRQIAPEDPFLIAILDSVPVQAVHGIGIQSEVGLRARFQKVQRVCRGVALVPPEGAGPLIYILSYLQSLLTFRVRLPDALQDELEKLDTYNILHIAEGRMRKGDLAGVVDCMAHLKGEPERVAKDWLVDARTYLETRQAIELMQTYMSASTRITNSS